MGFAHPVKPPKAANLVKAFTAVTVLALANFARAQSDQRDQWVEEPAAIVEGEPGHSYLDPASVRRGDDGLVYFNESTGVTKSEEIGQKGFMKNAYDCAKNLKYMCVGQGDWKNDPKSTVNTSKDPALPIYRKYLCSEGDPPVARTTQ
jgi:hypothetical protein